MERVMRAKMVASVTQNKNDKGEVISENMSFSCVTAGKFDQDGVDEDNTFAKWSPSGGASVLVMNPALFGKIKSGEKFYVDFVKAPE